MSARSTPRRRAACALLMAAGCLTLAPMDGRAAVMLQSVAIVDVGAPSNFALSWEAPVAGLTGMVQVTTSVIGVFADGARNGASLTPTGANLVTGSLRDSGNTLQPVTGVGGAASFAGAGGAAGVVQMAGVGVVDFNLPSNFSFSFLTPIAVPGNVTSHASIGAVLMDLLGDGASLTGNAPAGGISAFAVNGATHTELGSSFAAAGLAGSELDSGVAPIACSLAPCNTSEIDIDFILSGGGDAAALIARQEIGGDPIIGTVMQLYALASQTSVFDCGLAGCSASQFLMSFVASGGSDMYGFVIRQEVVSVTVPVPEPATIALVVLALAGWFAGRRRAASIRIA